MARQEPIICSSCGEHALVAVDTWDKWDPVPCVCATCAAVAAQAKRDTFIKTLAGLSLEERVARLEVLLYAG